jgi:hypothetical protein
VKITTHYDPKPIPVRVFDWSAIGSDTYDAEWLGAEDGWRGGPQGFGATEQEAVQDLMEQLGLTI